MSEKEKRKEKPKRSSRRFIGLSILMSLVLLGGIAWIFGILLKPDETCCDSVLSTSQQTAIYLTNEKALTQISASATEASYIRATHQVIRADAAATLERAYATAYYAPIQLTATALCTCFYQEGTLAAIMDARTAFAVTSAAATQNSIATVEAEIRSTMIYLQQTETSLPLWFYDTPTPNP